MTGKTSRDLMRGSMDLMVLATLLDEAKYGYLIQQRLSESSGGLVKLQAGTLYPLLHKLEDEKLIRSRWDKSSGRRRKWYELTATGRKRLKQQAHQWNEYAECLRKLLSPVLDAPPRPA